MSLDWKVNQIKDYKSVCWTESPNDPDKFQLSKLTDVLIWGTILVDLGEISEKNMDEWLRRIAVCEKLHKPFGDRFETVNGKRRQRELYPTREELESHIGLQTNVANRTFKQWYKKMCDNLLDDVDYKLRREK